MKRPPNDIPALYVEGVDDISAIAALMKRHGYDTERGKKHLFITHAGDTHESTGSDTELFKTMPDIIKINTVKACGFVFDIDTDATSRWAKVNDCIESILNNHIQLESPLPSSCITHKSQGYIGKIRGYPQPFGIWLMPDCKTDGQKLEHLIQTLIPSDDPILPHAKTCTSQVQAIVDDANKLLTSSMIKHNCFAKKDKIKAELRAWLAWQDEPGQSFGTAITRKKLQANSPEALAFLDWLSRLYGFKFNNQAT